MQNLGLLSGLAVEKSLDGEYKINADGYKNITFNMPYSEEYEGIIFPFYDLTYYNDSIYKDFTQIIENDEYFQSLISINIEEYENIGGFFKDTLCVLSDVGRFSYRYNDQLKKRHNIGVGLENIEKV